MKMYSLKYRFLLPFFPALLFALWLPFNITYLLLYPAGRSQLNNPYIILSLIIGSALSLGAIYFLLSFPYAVMLSDGIIAVKSILRRRLIPIREITHIVRISQSQRVWADAKTLVDMFVVARNRKTEFFMAPEHIDLFINDLREFNSDIQLIGFERLADIKPAVSADVTAANERSFKIRTRPLLAGLIIFGIFAGWLALSGLVTSITGIAGIIAVVISLTKGYTQIDLLFVSFGILLLGGGLLLFAWLLMRNDFRHPLDIRLLGDAFHIRTRIRRLVIPANDIQSICAFRKQSELIAFLHYRRRQKTGNLRIQLNLMPDFLEFVAAIRTLNPDVQLDGI